MPRSLDKTERTEINYRLLITVTFIPCETTFNSSKMMVQTEFETLDNSLEKQWSKMILPSFVDSLEAS